MLDNKRTNWMTRPDGAAAGHGNGCFGPNIVTMQYIGKAKVEVDRSRTE